MTRAFSRLGAIGAEAYLGVAFLLMAILVAFVGAGQLSATRPRRPRDGSTTCSFGRSPARRWYAGQALGGQRALLIAGGLIAGIFAWLGAASQAQRGELRERARGRAQRRPPGLCILGIGALVFGVWPRARRWRTYGVLVWSLPRRARGRRRRAEPLGARHLGLPPDGRRPGGRLRTG